MTAVITDLDAASKAWSTMAARACLKGYQLWRTDPDDGVQRFMIARWGMVHALASIDEVEAWLDHIEGHRP